MGLERWRYLGRRVSCPVCGGRFRSFAPSLWDGSSWHGPCSRCPGCGSRPRQRFLWLYLARLELGPDTSVLHVAPETAVAERLRGRVGHYTSSDMEPGRAELQADLTALPFGERSFDLVLCSHVLEHVPDDRAAMRELHRVLRDDGVVLIQTPVNYDQSATYEDPGVTEPDERLQRFSQLDHVRVFGPDLRERLESAGFRVTVEDAAALPAEVIARHGLQPEASPLRNDLYRCERNGMRLEAPTGIEPV